jgi:hypothetical protein
MQAEGLGKTDHVGLSMCCFVFWNGKLGEIPIFYSLSAAAPLL